METNMENRIGLGMYTVHRSVKEDMQGTFSRLAQMGYGGIEFYGEPGEYEARTVRHALESNKLEMVGWHVEWRNLQEASLGKTVDYLHAIGCPVAVIPCLGGKWNVAHDMSRECKDIWLYYAEKMNRLNDFLRKEGICLGYHNHAHEFSLQYEGKTVFDLLFENLEPSVIVELDTGNCIEGGGEPTEVLRKYCDRNILLHLKPYSREKGFDTVLGAPEDANDWQEILNEAGVKFDWLLVEGENEMLPGMENARLCMEGLRKYI